MASSGGKSSLFWRVNTITAYTMLAGAGAWVAAEAAATAVGTESAFRSVAGTALFCAVFAGIGFVVSTVTSGTLLRHYAITPTPEKRADGGA